MSASVLFQGDLGGQRTLQKKWTSFLKAKLVCSMPELNFVFNVVHDIFILKGKDGRDTVFYGVFTSQWSVKPTHYTTVYLMQCLYMHLLLLLFIYCFALLLQIALSDFHLWPYRGNVGLSAVCAYNMTTVEEVFSKGKYMQKATVEQSHTKWVRYNGITPSPRPGAVST